MIAAAVSFPWGKRPLGEIGSSATSGSSEIAAAIRLGAAAGVLAAAGAEAAVGQVITLSDGIGVPNRDFFRPYADLTGRRLLSVPTPVALAAAAVAPDDDVNPLAVRYMLRRGTYSNAKARRLLGWTPRVGLDEGLRRTVDWLRTQDLTTGHP